MPRHQNTRIQKLFDSIDLYKESENIDGYIYFKEKQRREFIENEASRIYSKWVIGELGIEKGCWANDCGTFYKANLDRTNATIDQKNFYSQSSKYTLQQSVACTMLFTHGLSALPFYLLSLAEYNKVPKELIADWSIDLAIICAIVSCKFKPGKAYDDNSVHYNLLVSEINIKGDGLGTAPSILQGVMGHLLKDAPFHFMYKDGLSQGLHNIELITNLLNLGRQEIYRCLEEVGLSGDDTYNELCSPSFSESFGKGESAGYVERIHKLFGENRFKRTDVSLLNQTTKEFVPKAHLNYMLQIINGQAAIYRSISSGQYSPLNIHAGIDGSDGNVYMWGKYGTSTARLCETILYDYFDGEIPPNSVTLLTYRVASVLMSTCEYTITSNMINDVVSLSFVNKIN